MTSLLTLAFGVEPYQIVAPAWLRSERYDVVALAPAGADQDAIRLMLRNLLVDRFGLRFDFETKNYPVYALTADVSGLKLRPGIPDPEPDNVGPIGKPITNGPNGRATNSSARAWFGVYQLTNSDGTLHYEFQNISMADLARFLTPAGGLGPFDLPIVDQTESNGRYQVSLEMAVSEAHRMGMPEQADTISAIPASLAKQGIHIVKRNVPMKTVVVQHLDRKPTEN